MLSNVENFKILKNANFQIYEDEFKSFTKEGPEICGFKGISDIDGWIHVSRIHYGGEGSGYDWDRFCDLLRDHSRGHLVAGIVWEGGWLERLEVQDGHLEVTDFWKHLEALENDL